jgi:hypothetical protein
MPRTLSPPDLKALVELSENGPGGNFDHVALSKLFTLGLIKINGNRRIVLTDEGRIELKEMAATAGRSDC